MLKVPLQNFRLIGVSVFLSLFSAVSIIAFTDPETASTSLFILLYASIFLTASGTALLVEVFLRVRFFAVPIGLVFGPSLRQAVLFGFCVVSFLMLSSFGILFWWVAGSLGAFFIFIEIFFSLKT